MNDILEGRSTAFERQGNRHADRFAKLGASKHPDVSLAKVQVGALQRLQEEIIRWGGVQDVLMNQRSWSDST
eukprot:500830-Pyramimonas_sp.AAC.1